MVSGSLSQFQNSWGRDLLVPSQFPARSSVHSRIVLTALLQECSQHCRSLGMGSRGQVSAKRGFPSDSVVKKPPATALAAGSMPGS